MSSLISTTLFISFIPVLASWQGVIWGILATALIITSLLLIAIILIQDPKGGGLTSAFGAGPGGDSIIGAQAQKGVTLWTCYFTIAFIAMVFLMFIFDPDKGSSAGDIGASTTRDEGSAISSQEEPEKDATEPLPPGVTIPPGKKDLSQPFEIKIPPSGELNTVLKIPPPEPPKSDGQ